jgi:hypothetical protein
VSKQRRPIAVSAVGWLWIVFGALAALGSAFVIAMLAGLAMMPEFRGEPQVLLLMGAGALELSLGVLGVIAGVSLLRLAPWSRPTLEGLTWLLLVLMVSILVYTVVGTPLGADSVGLAAGAALITALICGVPLALIVRSLRSETVRSAMCRVPDGSLPDNGI